ncbi:MAG: bifunctional DNA-formamidopyrimidine glycosylase/DNA-(apurinic or apyrimidinic site) lyase [Burkholderiales bacterium]
MPELPEVESTRRGLSPHLEGQQIRDAIVRNRALRWPIPSELAGVLRGSVIRQLQRRGKYLLFDCGSGWMIVHLGMSGSLRLLAQNRPAGKHDHFDLVLRSGRVLRLTDPRRFGAVLWSPGDPLQHPLLARLAPEPLGAEFTGEWIYHASRGRRVAIKNLIMDNLVVTGVGNIYASESLFLARISPRAAAGRISRARCDALVAAIRQTLSAAIDAGGSTLRNYVGSDGRAGGFQTLHRVYGRERQPCTVCGTPVRMIRQGQRATFFCPTCQR